MLRSTEFKEEQLKTKAFLELVKRNPDYCVKTVHKGEKTYAIEKGKGIIWIITLFKGEYTLDFMTKEDGEAIAELVNEGAGPIAIIPDEFWGTERGKKVIAESGKIIKSIEEHQKGRSEQTKCKGCNNTTIVNSQGYCTECQEGIDEGRTA